MPRRWNGDDGHPYSPLKRVLHQYRNSVTSEENSGAETSNSGSSGAVNGIEVVSSPPTSSTASTTSSAGRRPTATTAGMSFEEFVLGMLSKVGGGKAITAATQSYLRDSATAPTNCSGSGTTSRTTAGDDVQLPVDPAQRSRFDDRPPPYQTSEQRRQLEQQMLANTIQREEFNPSPYHPRSVGITPRAGLQYPTPDHRLIAPPPQLMPGTMRRLPLRADDRDEAYRERRRKNNEAAKRSRDTRRFKELQVAAQAERLAEENLQLKAEIAVLRSQLGYLHRMMLDNNNGSNVNGGVVNGTEEARPDDRHSNLAPQYPPEDGGRTV